MVIFLLCSNLLTQVGGFKLKFDLRRPRLQRLVLAEVNKHLRLVLAGVNSRLRLVLTEVNSHFQNLLVKTMTLILPILSLKDDDQSWSNQVPCDNCPLQFEPIKDDQLYKVTFKQSYSTKQSTSAFLMWHLHMTMIATANIDIIFCRRLRWWWPNMWREAGTDSKSLQKTRKSICRWLTR